MLYKNFTSWLKQSVASNVFLYTIWFYSIRRYRGDYVRLPADSDDFYFDGYPRSGNTFFAGLLERVYPHKEFADHLHVISGLKIALKLRLPIFVIIRDPKHAVISNLYRKVSKKNIPPDRYLIEDLLISYYNYYAFVKKHINSIHVLKFESCIKNELAVVCKIGEVAGFAVKSDNHLNDILNNFQALMKSKEEGKDSHVSSLPNNKRKVFKNKYLDQVLQSPSFRITKNIYNELIGYDLLIKNK